MAPSGLNFLAELRHYLDTNQKLKSPSPIASYVQGWDTETARAKQGKLVRDQRKPTLQSWFQKDKVHTEYQSPNSMHELQSQIDLGLTPILSPDLVERLSFTTTGDSLPHSGPGPARYIRYTISFNCTIRLKGRQCFLISSI